jgi:general stress protein 26
MTDEIKGMINRSLEERKPVLLAVVSRDSAPILSYRGSIQTYSDSQFGLWVRNVEGNTVGAIRSNPNVALMYRSSDPVALLQFHGKARIATDEAERTRVFEAAPERERNGDLERKGIAVIIDIARIEGISGIGPNGPIPVKMAG